MDERRSALVIANSEYEDEHLRQLVAPARDAEALERVLADREVGGFEVKTLLNRPARDVNLAIERFFLDRKREDLLLLYYSGHGLRDDDGQLYLTAVDTQLIEGVRPLRATAVGASFVRDVMRDSSSRRQVLVLDCCYSGAFAKALMSKGAQALTIQDQFEEGRGLVLLTASAAVQPSLEGGTGAPSVFTRHLIRGIETGDADLDGDGRISLDELYEYVHDRVRDETLQQRPMKWAFDVEGEIVIAQVPRAVRKPTELPSDLRQALENTSFPGLRVGAVRELGRILRGKHEGLKLSAREALLTLKDQDDSLKVRKAAEQSLAEFDKEQQQERERAETAERERLARELAERERLAREKAEAERRAAEAAAAQRIALEKAEEERRKAEAERSAEQRPEPLPIPHVAIRASTAVPAESHRTGVWGASTDVGVASAKIAVHQTGSLPPVASDVIEEVLKRHTLRDFVGRYWRWIASVVMIPLVLVVGSAERSWRTRKAITEGDSYYTKGAYEKRSAPMKTA